MGILFRQKNFALCHLWFAREIQRTFLFILIQDSVELRAWYC